MKTSFCRISRNRKRSLCSFVAAVHSVVLAASADNNVSAGAALHHRRTRLFADYVLRTRGATRADVADDQDLQQRGILSICI